MNGSGLIGPTWQARQAGAFALLAILAIGSAPADACGGPDTAPCLPGATLEPALAPTVRPTPPAYRDARLNFTDRWALEAELAAAVGRLAERYAADHPGDASPPPIEVRGYAEAGTARAIASRLGAALAIGDIDRLIRLVESQDIAPSYERRADGTLLFASALEGSADFRLHRAIERDEAATVARILDLETPDLERYAPVRTAHGLTPLLHALTLGHREITELLLAAGADPDTRDPGQSMSPLYRAMLDADERTVALLADAGADLDTPIGTGNRTSPVAHAINSGELELAVSLIELGADPNVTDYTGWTALMDALIAERTHAIEPLIAVSNPLIVTTEPITRDHRTKRLERRFFPRTNALYIAWQMASPDKDDIAAALLARAGAVDRQWGERRLLMQAHRSASRAAAFEGRYSRAIARLREALELADVSSFTPEVNGEVIVFAMETLTELHELLLIEGADLSPTERSQVALIASFGGWHAKLHDMLDAIAQARTRYPGERLERWRQAHGEPSHEDWDFTRLNDWVESMDEEPMRERLFDTLDFFELNWAVRRGAKGVVR